MHNDCSSRLPEGHSIVLATVRHTSELVVESRRAGRLMGLQRGSSNFSVVPLRLR